MAVGQDRIEHAAAIAWVQAIGFPATFCLVLLWALLWQLPQTADRIASAIERAAAAERTQLDEIRQALAVLLRGR